MKLPGEDQRSHQFHYVYAQRQEQHDRPARGAERRAELPS